MCLSCNVFRNRLEDTNRDLLFLTSPYLSMGGWGSAILLRFQSKINKHGVATGITNWYLSHLERGACVFINVK